MQYQRKGAEFHVDMMPLYTFWLVLCVSVFVSASVSSSEQSSTHSQEGMIETSDLICTEMSSQAIILESRAGSSLASNGEKIAYICQNLGSDYSNDLFRLIVFRGDSNHGVCLEAALIKWYTYCFRLPYSLPLSTSQHGSTPFLSKDMDRTTYRSKSATRHVDFLFLIEQPRKLDVNCSRKLSRAVRSLVKAMNEDTINVDARFSFVFYPLEGNENYVIAQDFSHDVSDTLKQFFRDHGKMTDELSGAISDPRLLRYMSVKENLKQVTKFLKLREKEKLKLHLHDNTVVTLSHPTHADLHILSFLDLSSKKLSTQEQDKKVIEIDGLIDEAKESIEEYTTRLLDHLQLWSTSDYPTSLHFFFASSNSAAMSNLGDPRHSVRYSDCTHFNKALTMKALLSSNNKDQANSLQAHLLSQGVEMQVHSWTDLQKEGCIHGVTPLLSTPAGLQYKFINVCQESTRSTSHHHEYYCSPLHGWTKKDKRRKSTLFEGKAPLTDQFLASHADLLKPVTSSSQADSIDTTGDSVALPAVQLTVDKVVDSNDWPHFEPAIEGQPRIVQWSPKEPFIEKMISKRRPAVLKNTVVETWSALKKWNMSYLESNMGVNVLPSVKCTNTFLTFDPDRRTPLKLNISLPFTQINMTTESFFKCIQQDPSDPVCSDGYKGHYHFGSVPDTLKEDVMPDTLLYHTEKDYKAKKQFMWISSAGMITHTHFDQDYNFFVQLVGKKRFTLWSSLQHELMYVYPRVHPMWHKSRVNFRSVDLDRFPAFSLARGKQIELGPGDMLFVPPYTWHYVETLTPSVSLSTWSHDYKLYDHMNSIYRHDHKFDLLEDSRGRPVL